jgi:WD40 repeat protein
VSEEAVTVRETRDGSRVASLPTELQYASAIAFSPDGRTAAVGLRGGVTLVGRDGRKLGRVWLKHRVAVVSVAFSPDGKELLATDEDGTMQSFDVDDQHPVGPASTASAQSCRSFGTSGKYATCSERVARSPDGAVAAVYGGGSGVTLWAAADGTDRGRLPAASFAAPAFSPDSATLATADGDNLALWSIARGQPIGASLPAGTGGVASVAFSTAGDRLVTGGSDGTARVWDPLLLSGDYDAWRGRLCAMVGRSLTREEWARFLPGQSYRETCAGAIRGQ